MPHLSDRKQVLTEFYRVLKHGGRLMYTDADVVTGSISTQELSMRSLIGYLRFSYLGENEMLIKQVGLHLLSAQDVTESIVMLSKRRYDARLKYRDKLIEIESETQFNREQDFYSTVNKLSSEKRLCRLLFLATKGDLG